MSEYINNSSKRKETVMNIIRQLHEGKTVNEVKTKFSTLLNEIGAGEIAQVEQMLIDEGLPVQEVQRMCDVHTAVFRDSLDKQENLENLPGHPIHTFQTENRIAGRALDALKAAIEEYKQTPSPKTLKNISLRLEKLREFNNHYLRKEYLLFPFLEKYNFSGPAKVMWGIHDDIRLKWKTLAEIIETGSKENSQDLIIKIETIFAPLESAIREMIYKEIKILFPAALERLSTEEWITIRNQENEIGYSYVRPGTDWPPKIHPNQVETDASIQTNPISNNNLGENQAFNLRTGLLTEEQINLLLTNLPFDVTFIDENDEVRYFSDTPHRIFQRPPAIIGRKVQNCHPPQSVSRVQKIIDDFRAGTQNSAEFWIHMQYKYIHIRYFALHDERGVYRGVIEVSQDITQIRNLEGEKRL